MQHTNSTLDHSTDAARVFFALWPDKKGSTALFTLGEQMQRTCGGRVMRREALHLTLLFLGEVPRQRLPDLLDAANQVHGMGFHLRLEEFSCWPHNRIGYLAPTELPAELGALSAALRQQVAAAGFAFDARAFCPHVTLLRNVASPIMRFPVSPLDWRVREFALVESVPAATGQHYQELKAWPLGQRFPADAEAGSG
ncbi:MAG: RNA 2',3'-cyclic phosphodiesterase [Nitrosomonadales bacterium]|nr:MAG: RNA 2',3'-cyclic phosphodiesterase [Nitrosomonadales bacterium]